MSDEQEKSGLKTPLHLWFVGVFALLWSGMGALDYVMTQTRNERYLSNFSTEQLEFFYSFPVFIVACWAIAVWAGVLGALLLLFRKKSAVWVFLTSLAAMVITTVHNYGFSNGLEVVGDNFSLIFTTVIFLFALAFFLYTIHMKKRGVLA